MAGSLLRATPLFLLSPRLSLSLLTRFKSPPPRRVPFVPSCAASTTVQAVHDPDASSAKLSALDWVNRTANCGDLGAGDVGKRVRLCGWVALHRIHGGLTFLNLRDSSGIVQVTTLPEEFPEAYGVANKLRVEYVVAVEGVVRSRPTESLNAKMKTGAIEVAAEHVQVLNPVNRSLPFPVTISDEVKDSVTEEIRLRYWVVICSSRTRTPQR